MYKRKKYPGGLKLLLSLLFIMLLGMSSTCYANVTQDYVDYTIDWLAENFIYDDTTMLKVHNTLSLVPQEIKDYIRAQINLNLQSYNLSALQDVNMICFVENNSTNQFKLHFTFSNVSAPNGVEGLDYVYVHISNGTWKVVSTADLEGSSSSGRIYDFIVTFNNNSGTPTNYYWTSYTNGTGFNLALWSYYILDGNFDITYSASWVASYIPFGYADQRIVATDPWTKHTTILTSNGGNYPPYIPSGDTSGDGGLGNIIGPSGEDNGNINLQPIQEELENINNSINTQGENIVNAIDNANENYWGSGDSLTGEEQEQQIEENLNDLMEKISGELGRSEVMQQLEGAETGFLDFFKNKQNEQALDLAFQWNETKYQGITLLESGEINISAMCREIPELGQLQTLIRVIFNFGTAIAIIYQIYNLVLSTLGIDNPYLYEDGQEITSIDTDTGEYRQFYKRRRRKL